MTKVCFTCNLLQSLPSVSEASVSTILLGQKVRAGKWSENGNEIMVVVKSEVYIWFAMVTFFCYVKNKRFLIVLVCWVYKLLSVKVYFQIVALTGSQGSERW